MIYAPRAIRHFSLAAAEARARRTGDAARAAPRMRPLEAQPRPALPAQPPRATRRFALRLWLPLTPLFLILAPFALLLAPLGYFAPRPYGDRPFATVLGLGALLLSLGGTVVDVDAPDARISIRIF